MIFQDPMTTLNPVLRIDTQMIETIRAHETVSEKAARDRALRAGSAGEPRVEVEPVRVLRAGILTGDGGHAVGLACSHGCASWSRCAPAVR